MSRQVIIEAGKCTGCGLCELACAIQKTGRCLPGLARIAIWRDEALGVQAPLTCLQCENPPCAAACLMNVIGKDPASGLTVRRLESCIGCRACQAACPFEGCVYDYEEDVVVNCDHCGGDPQCVKYCPEGALRYSDPDETLELRRNDAAARWIAESGEEGGPEHG